MVVELHSDGRGVSSARMPGLETSLANWLQAQRRSLLREMVSVVARPGVLSMAGGLPERSLFPRDRFADAYAAVLREDDRSLQYSPPSERLVEHVIAIARRRGIDARPEQVLITSGAQQGIDVATRMFLQEGAPLLLDEVSYTGIQQAAASRSPQWLEMPNDPETGTDAGTARELAGRTPSGAGLCYLISDGHNPQGTSLPRATRDAFAELAKETGIPIVEDDPYGLLGLDGELEPPIKALAPERVVYLGSFSKILAPGLRLGYMILPEELVEKAGVVKESTDLESSGLTQRVVAKVLDDDDFLDQHLEEIHRVYRTRRDALLEALERHMPSDARWSVPAAGMFVWLELAREMDTADFLERCVEEDGVAFLPGKAFVRPESPAVERARRSMRLSFSSLRESQYDQAVAALAGHL